MGKREVEFLRRRALEFLEAAQDDLRAGRTDLAAFHAEQALQLALKYLLARDFGSYPHTHDLRALFELIREHTPEIWDFYTENKYAIEIMIDAYIGARYLPREYRRDIVEHLVVVAKTFVERYVKLGS